MSIGERIGGLLGGRTGGQAVTDRGRFGELEPLGVIDIGSNSVRLVVYEGAVRSPTPLFNEKVLAVEWPVARR